MGQARKHDVSFANVDIETARKLAKAGGLAMLAVMLYLWWGKGSDEPKLIRAVGFGTALVVMLEMSEVSLTGHHVVLLASYVACLALLAAPGTPPTERRALRWAILIPFAALLLSVTAWTKSLSLLFFGTMAHWAVLAWLLWRYRRGRGIAPS